MRAAYFEQEHGQLVLGELPKPEPNDNEVLIKVHACGLCRGDTCGQHNIFKCTAYPLIPGHEVTGEIVEFGNNVTDFQIGERVGACWFGGCCGNCNSCVNGSRNTCENVHRVNGVSHNGGLAEYVVIDKTAVLRLPDNISYIDAAPLTCAGLTCYAALKNSNAKPNDIVAIVGIGALGHLGIQYANKMGFRTVAISRGDDKKDLSLELGADKFINSSSENVVEELQNMGGANVILVTAPSTKAVEGLENSLALFGEIIIVAAFHEKLNIDAGALLMKKACIKGWKSGDNYDARETIDFSIFSDVKSRNEVFSFSDSVEAFQSMTSSKAMFKVVVDFD